MLGRLLIDRDSDAQEEQPHKRRQSQQRCVSQEDALQAEPHANQATGQWTKGNASCQSGLRCAKG